jgi:hypothetical protein
MQVDTSEWFEAIDELSHLFVLIQAAGRKLANETHGNTYDLSQEMNELLRMARGKLGQIEDEAFGSAPRKADRRSSMMRRISDARGR